MKKAGWYVRCLVYAGCSQRGVYTPWFFCIIKSDRVMMIMNALLIELSAERALGIEQPTAQSSAVRSAQSPHQRKTPPPPHPPQSTQKVKTTVITTVPGLLADTKQAPLADAAVPRSTNATCEHKLWLCRGRAAAELSVALREWCCMFSSSGRVQSGAYSDTCTMLHHDIHVPVVRCVMSGLPRA